MGQGRDQQKGGKELAGNIAPYGYAATAEARRVYPDRRVAILLEILDVGAQLSQGVHQVFDGTLVHPGRACKGKDPLPQAKGRAKGPYCRASISQKQLCFLRRERAALSINPAASFVLGQRQVYAQLLKRVQHVPRVVAVQ